MSAHDDWYVVKSHNEVYVRNRRGVVAERYPPSHYQGQDERYAREVKDYHDEMRLISSAPDLLEALENVVAAWDAMYAKTKMSEPHSAEMENMEFRQFQKARAAIAKAEGKQP
tara:strand:+ start:563 stop:901 length:339 start_codon:yes stop_codon:yes gene_type:complete